MHITTQVVPDAVWNSWMAHWQPEQVQARQVRLLEKAGAMVEGLARRTAPRGASSQLAASHAHRVIRQGNTTIGIVGAMAPHAVVIHEGRRPGTRMPPPDALIPWIRFKGMAGKGAAANRPEALRGIAFVLARAIGVRGIKGRPWLYQSYIAMKPAILEAFANSLRPRG